VTYGSQFDPGPHYDVPEGRELTNFDKLAIRVILTGIFVMLFLHLVLVGDARDLYGPLDDVLPGLTRIVFHLGYPVMCSLLMGYLAYYGARLRKLYDARSASRILFLGILVTIASNGLLVYALYAPASGATEMFRNLGHTDDE